MYIKTVISRQQPSGARLPTISTAVQLLYWQRYQIEHNNNNIFCMEWWSWMLLLVILMFWGLSAFWMYVLVYLIHVGSVYSYTDLAQSVPWLGHELYNQGIRVPFPAWARNSSLLHIIHMVCGMHLVSVQWEPEALSQG